MQKRTPMQIIMDNQRPDDEIEQRDDLIKRARPLVAKLLYDLGDSLTLEMGREAHDWLKDVRDMFPPS